MQEREPPTRLETALQRDRGTLAIILVAIPAVAWIWIASMALDMYGSMQGASAWMMSAEWGWARVVLLWAMWAVMMIAMMLPTAAPLILIYAAAMRRNPDVQAPARRIYALAMGYVFVWTLFSVAATALQRVLARSLVLTPMMEPATPIAGAAVLAIAGVYQLTPLKRACLRACRSPLGFMMQRWRDGAAAAFRLGVAHGVECLGCCWALMLILFAGGVMNLVVILALTAWVLVEKLAPFGERTSTASGILLLAMSIWMSVR